MKIAIVIVNYKTPDLVIQCLESLRSVDREHYDIKAFIGDAASGDGSVDLISDYIRNEQIEWAHCFDIGKNGGFAYGNNFIVEHHVNCEPAFDFVHFLNPDTYIRDGAVSELADFLASHPRAGVAGSQLENPDGSTADSAFRFPAPWREFFRAARLSFFDRYFPASSILMKGLDGDTEVDWVSGASFMVPRSVLDRVGPMDDRYFLYFEEVDLMARVSRAGYDVWYVPESRVVHLEGQSTGVIGKDVLRNRIPSYWFRSRHRYFRNHHGAVGAMMANMLFIAGDLFYRLHRTLRLRSIDDPPYLLRDFLAFSFASDATSDPQKSQL